MRRGNDWERRYGRRRRAIDRGLLEELERQIGLEEAIAAELERAAAEPPPDDGARARLARAFGRAV
jgi:hypothetical protein